MEQYFQFFKDIKTEQVFCEKCHAYHRQMKAKLEDGTPVMILESQNGFHVHVGPGKSFRKPVSDAGVMDEVKSQWSAYVR